MLLMLFGGPMGWILALASSGDSDGDGPKMVKKTVKVTMPQCILCRAETGPKVVEAQYSHGLYRFWVHPQFSERYLAANAEQN